jgi:hypothetical protein
MYVHSRIQVTDHITAKINYRIYDRFNDTYRYFFHVELSAHRMVNFTLDISGRQTVKEFHDKIKKKILKHINFVT